MEFIKNDLIDIINQRTYESFSKTLDTDDFVDKKYNKKIDKKIFKNMKEQHKKVNVYYLLILEDKGLKLTLLQKLKVWFSGVRPIYNVEKAERKKQEELEEQKRLERDQKRIEREALKKKRKRKKDKQ